jgi:hypothetical protein
MRPALLALAVAPPALALCGYGGIVCLHPTGALSRIRRSFAEAHLASAAFIPPPTAPRRA